MKLAWRTNSENEVSLAYSAMTKNAGQPKAKIDVGLFLKPANLFLFWQSPWLINPVLFYLFSNFEETIKSKKRIN
jgi:hypothetical protein